MARIVKVVISNIINKIDRPYDYIYPFEDDPIGKRVVVGFGKANACRKALVMDCFESDEITGLKTVIDVLDQKAAVTPKQIELIKFLKEQYFITYYRALSCILPTGLDFKVDKRYCLVTKDDVPEYAQLFSLMKQSKKGVSASELTPLQRVQLKEGLEQGLFAEYVQSKRNIGDLADKMISLAVESDEAEQYLQQLPPRFQGQRDILRLLIDCPNVSVKEALYMTGCSVSSMQTLAKKGWVQIYFQPRLRAPVGDFVKGTDLKEVALNEQQQDVYNAISSCFGKGRSTHLIHGVTGSGKTHVYMKLMDRIIEQKQSVLFMVPEISLTPQTLSRFYAHFGEKVAVIHSGLSMGQRLDEWKKIRDAEVSVVVGTRSAVFAPIQNLGLIIMDEEHEASYKSESTPKFHARDVARFLSAQSNIPLILGSATPSLESFYNARNGKYTLHAMTDRFNLMPLPEVEMVDMREETAVGETSFLSTVLRDRLIETIQNKQQAILFLNRRGTHTHVMCQKCGYVLKCPSCGISMTYHAANNRCICHFCSYSVKMLDHCPSCSDTHIKMTGFGTQHVEKQLSQLLPNCKILRMDMDTVTNYVSYQTMLRDFAEHKYDILLGTQMVAKGLNLPDVTLVGVLQADMSLFVDDFRSGERTFSLLTQVCGRSGRSKMTGTALIQSYCPEHEVLRFAKNQDYLSFYDYEIKFRKAINYPPFCDIALFMISAKQQNVSLAAANELFECLQHHAANDASDIPLRLLRPSVPRIQKINDKYRMQMLVKCKNSVKLRKMALESVQEIQSKFNVTVTIDINPLSF